MLNQLNNLDTHATFRFLDLPPEMRNMVYHILLSHKSFDQRPALYAQILRTSKYVYAEANGRLYAEATMHINISSTATWNGVRTGGVKACAEVVVGTASKYISAADSGLSSSLAFWPSAVSGASNIALSISLHGSRHYQGKPHIPSYIKVNHELFSLATRLQAAGHLKEITITFVDCEVISLKAQLAEILFPLTLLSSTIDFTFDGLDDDFQARFNADLTPSVERPDVRDQDINGLDVILALGRGIFAILSEQGKEYVLSFLCRSGWIEQLVRTRNMIGAREAERLAEEIRLLISHMDGGRLQKQEAKARLNAAEEVKE